MGTVSWFYDRPLLKQIWHTWENSGCGRFLVILERLGSHLSVTSCLLLPAIQLGVGISHPSWLSLPFFICSCVGLVDWSLTSNFLGLFRWWRPLQLYASLNIILLYVYQLPVEFPSIINWVADFIGLFKICAKSEWPNICSSLFLVLFYIMVCIIQVIKYLFMFNLLRYSLLKSKSVQQWSSTDVFQIKYDVEFN
ncbi:hypothetical protein K2173_018415 [Erythroxylum novogranatense]|uniref:Uncharacterized protein n=1 Tax=Erythroxylum novogranatense TaxID=1862640 RepID=A0AAV8UF32_9ROSI|nr:hypothetical protein K2173_018415 [Erythroxylum novogranatense]